MADVEEDDWDFIPDTAPVKFDSAEHADIPAECYLKFSENGPELSGKAVEGALFSKDWVDGSKKGTFHMTFAKAIALAGDFFTNDPIAAPISYGDSFQERINRFERAIGSMTSDPTNILPRLDPYLSNEANMIETVLSNVPLEEKKGGETKTVPPEETNVNAISQHYKNSTGGVTNQFKTFTDMGILSYAKILLNNMDHFGQMAWDVYKAGHSLALSKAIAGSKLGTVEKKEAALKEAYLYDAFALHYLSDQFASGHTRTPRMEMNHDTFIQSMLKVVSQVPVIGSWGGGWDGMTGFMHEFDNATGVRQRNENGDRWIAYGDAQFFLEPNRINRLKSIECVQASITEIFDTWKNGKYPAYLADGSGQSIKNGGDVKDYKALRLVPVPDKNGLEENNETTGNPIQVWVTFRNGAQQNAYETINKIPAPNPSAVLPPEVAKQIRGSPSSYPPENGYWFARRTDLENCCESEFQWGSPGISFKLVDKDLKLSVGWSASYDCQYIQDSGFYKQLALKEARPVEVISGGFIQIQEYRAEKGTKVNYAVNVWGPVQVPINYTYMDWVDKTAAVDRKPGGLTRDEQATKDRIKGTQMTAKDRTNYARTQNRQYTFTFRGRRDALSATPETISSNKTFRWHSWFDPSGSGKTSLVKFSLNTDSSKIVVESWSMTNPDPDRNKQQWTKYEGMPQLEFDNQKPSDISKFVLLENFSSDDWDKYARMTRFFIFPFTQGSGPQNPDIVVFTWRLVSGVAKPVITVASTNNQLSNPKIKPNMSPPVPQDIESLPNIAGASETTDKSQLVGIIKQFEDVNKTGLILLARASYSDKTVPKGLMFIPTVFEHDAAKNEIRSQTSKLPWTLDTTPSETTDFFRVLVGDTRYSGHSEVVVMTGNEGSSMPELFVGKEARQPQYYIGAWEYNAKTKAWNKTSGDSLTRIPPATDVILDTSAYSANYTWTYQFCALIPNAKKDNGLNLLSVASYDGYNDSLVFRTYVKDGNARNVSSGSAASRPAAGWSSYYESWVSDNMTNEKSAYFKSMGWRMCKVGTIYVQNPPQLQDAVMQIFSFHGVIGCRVYAPRTPGDYNNWVLRGLTPYLGQTSLGTGYDSLGRWNDNASQLSWGFTTDFPDLTYYNELTSSWHIPSTMKDVQYARGFESKTPGPNRPNKPNLNLGGTGATSQTPTQPNAQQPTTDNSPRLVSGPPTQQDLDLHKPPPELSAKLALGLCIGEVGSPTVADPALVIGAFNSYAKVNKLTAITAMHSRCSPDFESVRDLLIMYTNFGDSFVQCLKVTGPGSYASYKYAERGIYQVEIKARIPKASSVPAGSPDSFRAQPRYRVLSVKTWSRNGNVARFDPKHDDYTDAETIADQAPNGWELKGWYGAKNDYWISRLGPIWGAVK